MINVFCVPGTWEFVDQSGDPVGMIQNTTDQLDASQFNVVYIPYDASFGPVGGPADSPSYNESVQNGVQLLEAAITSTPGKFVLIGYSQGAEVVARVAADVESPGNPLHARLADLLHGYTFGPPCRAQGYSTDNDLIYQGISTFRPVLQTEWSDYCYPEDMYGNANPESFLEAGYSVLTALQVHDPAEMANQILGMLQSGQLQQEAGLNDPMDLWNYAVNTFNELVGFFTTNAHTAYASREVKPGVVPTDEVAASIGQLAPGATADPDVAQDYDWAPDADTVAADQAAQAADQAADSPTADTPGDSTAGGA